MHTHKWNIHSNLVCILIGPSPYGCRNARWWRIDDVEFFSGRLGTDVDPVVTPQHHSLSWEAEQRSHCPLSIQEEKSGFFFSKMILSRNQKVYAVILCTAHHLLSALPSHHYPLNGCLVASLPPWGCSAGEPADHRCSLGNLKWGKSEMC